MKQKQGLPKSFGQPLFLSIGFTSTYQIRWKQLDVEFGAKTVKNEPSRRFKNLREGHPLFHRDLDLVGFNLYRKCLDWKHGW